MTQSGLSFPSIPHQLSCLTGKSTLRLCAEGGCARPTGEWVR